MSLLRIDPSDPSPPFEQLRIQLARMIADGKLAPGEKLPTVRQLAADLGLAVNTVARSYRELEADGIINTQGRRGTFVRSAALDDSSGAVPADARAAAMEFASMARAKGLSLAESTRLVEAAWLPETRTAH